MFCALMLGAELGQALERALAAALRGAEQGALGRHARSFAPVRGADMHLTLAFAGALEEPAALRFEGALARSFAGAQGPGLELGRADAFPDPRRARVLVVRVRELCGTHLADLATRAVRAAEEAGVELPDGERPFSPHVTLARVRERRGRRPAIPEAFFGLDFALPWQPRAAAWVESPGGGAPYRVVAEFLLAEGSPEPPRAKSAP